MDNALKKGSVNEFLRSYEGSELQKEERAKSDDRKRNKKNKDISKD
ncbi:hypothetical protein FACS1894105_06800 [Clostridia bacterium]|nr:hypothetical protein FACS1894105_06800 [Clostridia bacterium]